jgi:hypothetical protein
MHNQQFLDFGAEVVVIFTGIKTGKSSFLESESNQEYHEYYGSSCLNYNGWKILEQDSLIIDNQERCICHNLKLTSDCFLNSKLKSPMIFLVATNLKCWSSSIKNIHIFSQKYYNTSEWYNIIKDVTDQKENST